MLTDLLIQLFDQTPRRSAGLYLLLTGKKTPSVLYAAMVHQQLQWLQLLPGLSRPVFEQAVRQLVQQEALSETEAGYQLRDSRLQAAAQTRLPLPPSYAVTLNVGPFAQRLLLAVQVASEAAYRNPRYRPVESDLATQSWIRHWVQASYLSGFSAELTEAFSTLPEPVADGLANRFVGHQFVGAISEQGLANQLALIEAVSQLAALCARHPEWQSLNALWGGPTSVLTDSQVTVLNRLAAGQTRRELHQQLRIKPSTIDEHVLTATILGFEPPLLQLVPRPMLMRLGDLPATDYHALLARVPGADFFAVRLYQILKQQGRWPDDFT